MSGSSSRVSIRKTIQNLKEIAKNHSDDEIYAMLRDCNMDPNETAQKLLFQDPFHEVKRKRDKRKENNKEPADTRWRPVLQGRMGQGSQGNYPSHYTPHDARGEGKIWKENGIHQSTKKDIVSSSSPPSQDAESKSTIPISSSAAGLPNYPLKIENPVPLQGSTSTDSSVSCTVSRESLGATVFNKTRKSATGDAKSSVPMRCVSTSNNHLSPPKLDSQSKRYTSASEPVSVPSPDASFPSSVVAMKREGNRWINVDTAVKKFVSSDVSISELSSLNGKGSSEMNHSYLHEKMQGKSQVFDGNQCSDASQVACPLSRASSAVGRLSSDYSNRSQQLNSPPKAGPVKEWKPKSNVKPVSAKLETTDVEPTTKEAAPRYLTVSSSMPLDESTSKLQSKLEELQFSDSKHVIIPDHLQVPESERTGLSFGSFDANFGLTKSFVNDTGSEKRSAELLESSQANVENVDEPTSSIQIASPSGQEAEIADHSQSPAKMPENDTLGTDNPESAGEMSENLTSREPDILSGIPTAQEYNQATTEVAPAPESSQYSVHTTPTYPNFGLAHQMLGNQFTTFEGAEPQSRDASCVPNFPVQQRFDMATSYYTSMYHPTTADGDGRFSPFFAPATKYSSNIPILPAQSGQTQESGNSLVLSLTGPAPLVSQGAGAIQSSVAVSQQSVPVFRQPPGVHISHYSPSYLPYGQFFPPFYIPSPSMHPFLNNAAFPQQPPTGNAYPGVPGAASIKYSISQYKPASNVGSPSHIGMAAGYGTCNSGPVTTGSSAGSEDPVTSQYNENNAYIAAHQSEGSVWIPTSGRDISSMQATTFYNLPPQGRHMALPGIYHHATPAVAASTIHPMLQQSQAIAGAVEMAGPPPGGVYQHPQRTQMNWVNNY